MRHRFTIAARDDLVTASNYYESQRAGLGVEFAVEVGLGIAKILDAPERWPEMAADEQGLLKSGLLAGLWLDAAALLKHDLPQLLAGVDAGAGTAEHGEFVKRLAPAHRQEQ